MNKGGLNKVQMASLTQNEKRRAMATSEQREQESRWLARKAIRRAMMCLTRAEEADDTHESPRIAVLFTAKAMNECKTAERHYQRAITEMKKNQKALHSMPVVRTVEAEKQNATCISCRFFTPYSDGDPNGRCCLGNGTYCTHTLGTQEACGQYRERGQE